MKLGFFTYRPDGTIKTKGIVSEQHIDKIYVGTGLTLQLTTLDTLKEVDSDVVYFNGEQLVPKVPFDILHPGETVELTEGLELVFSNVPDGTTVFHNSGHSEASGGSFAYPVSNPGLFYFKFQHPKYIPEQVHVEVYELPAE